MEIARSQSYTSDGDIDLSVYSHRSLDSSEMAGLSKEEITQANNQKIIGLKQLCAKLKYGMEKYKKLADEKEKEASDLKIQLQKVVESIGKNEKNSENELEYEEMKARVEVDSVMWCLVSSKTERVKRKLLANDDTRHFLIGTWIRESLIEETVKYKQTCLAPSLNYNKIVNQQIDELKKKNDYEKNMKDIMVQYEKRLNRMQNELEIADENSLKLKKELDEGLKSVEALSKTIEFSLASLLETSLSARESQVVLLNWDIDKNMRDENKSKVKIALTSISQHNVTGNLPPKGQESEVLLRAREAFVGSFKEFRDHVIMLHQSIDEAINRLELGTEEQKTCEVQFKEKLEQANNQIKKERRERLAIIEQAKNYQTDAEKKLESLNEAYLKEKKEKEIQIEVVASQAKKNVNLQYIKNLILRYLTTRDANVRATMVPAIGSALVLSEEETEQIRKVRFGFSIF